MNERDCVGSLLKAIERHLKEPKVVKNSCMALAALVEPSGKTFFLIVYHTFKSENTTQMYIRGKIK